MQNEQYPLHNHYLLMNKHTMKPFKITLNNQTYMFAVNKQYFLNQKKDFFSLKEKLYILNLPFEVIWYYIPGIAYLFMIIFLNVISPSGLKLNINKGKVTPYIQKGGF